MMFQNWCFGSVILLMLRWWYFNGNVFSSDVLVGFCNGVWDDILFKSTWWCFENKVSRCFGHYPCIKLWKFNPLKLFFSLFKLIMQGSFIPQVGHLWLHVVLWWWTKVGKTPLANMGWMEILIHQTWWDSQLHYGLDVLAYPLKGASLHNVTILCCTQLGSANSWNVFEGICLEVESWWRTKGSKVC